jgi:hypothetical protein
MTYSGCRRLKKKANMISDGIIVLVVIFVVGISSIYGHKLLSDVNDDVQNDPEVHNETKILLQDYTTKYPSALDGLFVLMFALLWIMVLVASYLIDSHPVFLVPSFILLIFVLICGGLLANAYEEIVTEDDLGSFTDQQPMGFFIITHIIEFMIAICMTIALVLYAKFRNG